MKPRRPIVCFAPWLDDSDYTRRDSQWFIYNGQHPSHLYFNETLTETTTAGNYDCEVYRFWRDVKLTQTSTLVGIIDTGAAVDHPQLAGKIVDHINFNGSNPDDVTDLIGHGTATAGIISAEWLNAEIRGIARAPLLLARTSLRSTGLGLQEAKAIEWCVEQGAKVINLPWGTGKVAPSFRKACDYAAANDVVIVASTAD